jgi:HAD superfamily hydrolase (TIGR01509 family)
VAAVAGDAAEEDVGDAVRDAWERHYDAILDEVVPLPGAADLVAALDERGFQVSLASSGIPRHTRYALEVLGIGDRIDAATTSEDAEESKPDPELVQVALEDVDADRAVLVGDSVWDVRSAHRAGLPVVGLLCGGFGRAELEDEGADVVYEDPREVVGRLDELLRRTA